MLYESPFKFFTRRPIGRYVDPAILLLLLGGFISFKKLGFDKKKYLKLSIIFAAILAMSAQLTIAELFPFNNQSLTLFGTINYVLHILIKIDPTRFYMPIFLIFLALFAITPLIFNLKIFNKRVIPLTLLFLIISSTLALAVTIKASNDWDNSEQLKLSRFVGEKITNKNILFDEDNCKFRVLKEDYMAICQFDKKN